MKRIFGHETDNGCLSQLFYKKLPLLVNYSQCLLFEHMQATFMEHEHDIINHIIFMKNTIIGDLS